jgi:hypothetical protein
VPSSPAAPPPRPSSAAWFWPSSYPGLCPVAATAPPAVLTVPLLAPRACLRGPPSARTRECAHPPALISLQTSPNAEPWRQSAPPARPPPSRFWRFVCPLSRDAIGGTLEAIFSVFGIKLDVESALRHRGW